MSRAWRIEYEGALYHLMSRGNEGGNIFFEKKDRVDFLDTVGEMSERYDFDIFAYGVQRTLQKNCVKSIYLQKLMVQYPNNAKYQRI